MGGDKLVSVQGKKKGEIWSKSTPLVCGGDSSSPQRMEDVRSIYEGQDSNFCKERTM